MTGSASVPVLHFQGGSAGSNPVGDTNTKWPLTIKIADQGPFPSWGPAADTLGSRIARSIRRETAVLAGSGRRRAARPIGHRRPRPHARALLSTSPVQQDAGVRMAAKRQVFGSERRVPGQRLAAGRRRLGAGWVETGLPRPSLRSIAARLTMMLETRRMVARSRNVLFRGRDARPFHEVVTRAVWFGGVAGATLTVVFVGVMWLRFGSADDDDPLALPLPVVLLLAVVFGAMFGGFCALVAFGVWIVTTSWLNWARYLAISATVAASTVFIAL